MKEEALKLADILEGYEMPNDTQMFEASAMIRKLVEELDKQGEPVAWMNPSQVLHGVIDARTYCLNGFIPLYAKPQTKPLSDEETHEIANKHLRTQNQDGHLVVLGLEDFARAIEERHGIK